jgi:predicted kinase
VIQKFDDYNNLNEHKVISFKKPQGNFVVMTGSPGAGKSMIASNFVNLNGYKYVNVDLHRERKAKQLGLDLENPEHNQYILNITYTTSDPRNATIKQLKALLTDIALRCRKQLPNILFDAGGGQVEVIKAILELAKEAGYITTMVYVKADLGVCLKRNRERQRKLPEDMVIQYYNTIIRAYKELIPFYDNVWVVDNNNKVVLDKRPDDKITKVK